MLDSEALETNKTRSLTPESSPNSGGGKHDGGQGLIHSFLPHISPAPADVSSCVRPRGAKMKARGPRAPILTRDRSKYEPARKCVFHHHLTHSAPLLMPPTAWALGTPRWRGLGCTHREHSPVEEQARGAFQQDVIGASINERAGVHRSKEGGQGSFLEEAGPGPGLKVDLTTCWHPFPSPT